MKQNNGITICVFIISLIILSTLAASTIQKPLSADDDFFYSTPQRSYGDIQNFLHPSQHSCSFPLGGDDDFNFSETGQCVRQTSDGGYIVVGSSYLSVNTTYIENVLLIKTDNAGNEIWNKTFSGLGYAEGLSILETGDHGYIITGSTIDNRTHDSSILLLKTDINGNKIWQKTISVEDGCYGTYLQNTSDGGYIITGGTSSSDSILLVKTDGNGNMQWNQTFKMNEHDIGMCVQQTNDGGFIIAGYTLSFSFEDGFNKAVLIKTNNTGMQEWNKTIMRGNGSQFFSVTLTADNKYLATGFTATYDGYNSTISTLLYKIDADGNEEWNKTIGPSNSTGTSIQRTVDNGFVIAGVGNYNFSSGGSDNENIIDVLLMKIDANGNEQWNKTYDIHQYDVAYFVQQTNDHGYIITGTTMSRTTMSTTYDTDEEQHTIEIRTNYDLLLIKTDTNGTLQWEKIFGWTTITPPAPDIESPHVSITKPVADMLYWRNEAVRPSLRTIIFGGIMIEVNATDNQSGINRVEFYIDGVLKGNDTNASYTYNWDQEKMRIRFSKHKHVIKVIAYDNAGNSATDEIEVLRFF